MNKNLKVSKSIEIKASPAEVWDALVNPEKIKVYLFGTETITDWQIGSPIIFQGEYEGQVYKDKGNVLEVKPYEILKYDYWSGFSGMEDKPENYAVVTYTLEANIDHVKFTWTQEGFGAPEGQQHMESGLPAMLDQIKNLVEA
jgi:uncharacterized protein YndB with AHSA1/START domain